MKRYGPCISRPSSDATYARYNDNRTVLPSFSCYSSHSIVSVSTMLTQQIVEAMDEVSGDKPFCMGCDM